MQRPNLLAGGLSRQQWWTGLMILIAAWLVWSLASGFMFAGASGQTASAWISLVFLVPLTVLCAKRLNDLGRPLLPILPLLMAR